MIEIRDNCQIMLDDQDLWLYDDNHECIKLVECKAKLIWVINTIDKLEKRRDDSTKL